MAELRGEDYLIKKEAVHLDLGDLPTLGHEVHNPTLYETSLSLPHAPGNVATHNSGGVLVLLSAGSA